MRKSGKRNEIEIIGDNVERLHSELSDVAGVYEHSVVTRNLDPSFLLSDAPVTSNWIRLCGRSKSTTFCGVDGHDASIIESVARTRDKSGALGRFALTSAHAVLSEKQNKVLMSSQSDYYKVAEEVKCKCRKGGFSMNVRDCRYRPRGVDNVFFAYQYWVREGVESYWSVVRDIVFLGLPNMPVPSNNTRSRSSTTASKQPSFPKIFPEEELAEYGRKRILCAGKYGTVCDSPLIKDKDFVIGNHLAFELDNFEK